MGLNVLTGHSQVKAGRREMGQRTVSCVVTPQQTEGPYFVDERLHRSDIRSDPSDGSVKEGLPLALEIRVFTTKGNRDDCKALENAIVDVWHCDAQGIYSDVMDPGFNTAGEKFLRGYQVTDENGSVRFITIYPGWYPGRTIHIHFKIRTDSKHEGEYRKPYEFTSQLYFDDAITDKVHAQLPYSNHGRKGSYTRRTRNEEDGIFRQGGNQLMLNLAKTTNGYAATFDVGLAITA
jgi:protocatechuate 3,4-dioxygenase beta subunit